MKLINLAPGDLFLSSEFSRSGSAKAFEERLRSSILEIGLAEPLKVARHPNGEYLVIDGTMRVRAIRDIRKNHPERFTTVAAYVLEYSQRYEIRYQSDIYQDLLPSQLAALVEHLHKTESVLKADIARYIGVSPATLRNYTGLWRLMERGGFFASIVELMDVGVIPASTPYAWLRLTDHGLRKVLLDHFSKGEDLNDWIGEMVADARLGNTRRYPLKFVELVTATLPEDCFRVGLDVRAIKRDLGLRRAATKGARTHRSNLTEVVQRLAKVSTQSREPVLRSAAQSLQEYLA